MPMRVFKGNYLSFYHTEMLPRLTQRVDFIEESTTWGDYLQLEWLPARGTRKATCTALMLRVEDRPISGAAVFLTASLSVR